MIVRRLHLHPFAGTSDRELAFERGLNVVLGPNEAGKTTMGNALRQLLFVSTRLSKREAEREVMPFLPIGGGDTIRVTADLEHRGDSWRIQKSWVSGQSATELTLPDGAVLTDPDAAQTALAERLLELNQGTWEHVLFAFQGGVGAGLERLGEEKEEFEDLNELLRRAVFETDGVSLEGLAESIAHRWKDHFGRWDREARRPEGNRGLDQPWKREAGSIVTAWYERERARIAREEAESYYRRLDEVTTRIQTASQANESLESWVTSHEAVATDAEKRATLEGTLAKVAAREKEGKQISQAWPAALEKIAHLDARIAEQKKRITELSEQLTRAQAWQAAGRRREILQRAEVVVTRGKEAAEAEAKLAQVDPEKVRELETVEQECLRLRARLEAARLSVTIRSSRDSSLNLETQAGIEPPETHALSQGEALAFEAGAQAAIRHSDWEVEVRSGEIDVEAEQNRFRELSEKTANLLETLGAADREQAQGRLAQRREHQREVESLRRQLTEILDGHDLETLRKEVSEQEDPKDSSGSGGGNPAEIAESRGKAQAEIGNLEREITEMRRQVAGWETEHISPDALLDKLIDARAERQEAEKAITALRPLPDDAESAEVFLADFRRRKGTLEEYRRSLQERLIEKAQLEGQAPEVEPAEAEEQLVEAETRFDQAEAGGRAIDRIRIEFEKLRERLDQGTLEPWLKHLGEIVAPLTADRYREIDLGAGTFARKDDRLVPFAGLSMGTRACLGLAVRLSMARWFLEDRDGFLILDDPLVDLDPPRQDAAATLLRHFAQEKQVILLTCHPAHAELLGGNRMVLEPAL